jgi:hypothetical protein
MGSRSGKSNWAALNAKRQAKKVELKKKFASHTRITGKSNPLRWVGQAKERAAKAEKVKLEDEQRFDEGKSFASINGKLEPWQPHFGLGRPNNDAMEVLDPGRLFDLWRDCCAA